jgi:outer membrane receptor protein involved in Fe transport
MKNITLLVMCLMMSLNLIGQMGNFRGGGQSTITGKISGTVVDTTTNLEVAFATISMKRAGRTKIINGTLTEVDGKFIFRDIKPGKYDIEVSFLGYDPKLIATVETTKKNPDADLETVFLVPKAYMLEEITVSSKKALFENKVDRIVFNAEDDSSISGGDATDVLRKVPNLSVDLDGNVSIRGSQNIRILINGKPSGMFSSNVAEALKMFPADEIKRVEVITSPGAKYDAEGSGGIINIVTKKGNIEGIAGSINAAAGNRSSNSFANLNMGKGRFGSTFNGSIFYSHPNDATFYSLREEMTGFGTNKLESSGISNTSRLGFRGSANAFYDFNAFNAINTSFNFRGYGFDRDGTFNTNFTNPDGSSGFSFTRGAIEDNIVSGYDWSTDYTRKFENNEGQELVIAYQLSKNDQDQESDVILEQINSSSFTNYEENIFNDGDNWESTIQVDYTHPFPNSIKLEVGAKAILRDINSDSRYSVLNEDIGEFELDPVRSNIFNYDQDVMAGYAQINYTLGKLQFITGLRYEHTEIGGIFDQSEFDFDNNYDNWVPSFTISRPLKNFRNLKLSYSKRIQRPSLFNINPFVNSTDPTNISQGNPALDPEITHQIEVGYNTRFLGINIFSSGYYKRTNDIIEQVLLINENGQSLNTFSNVGTNNSFGINMFVNKSIKKVTFRIGGDVFTYNATGLIQGVEFSNTDLNYQIFTGGEYAISGAFKADFFGFFRSPRTTLQGTTPSFSIFGVGFRREWGNISLGIRIIEPFSENKSFDSDQTGINFTQVTSTSIPFRSFQANVRYKFGKVDFRERRSKIRNDDQKGGGDQQGGQGGGSGVQPGGGS